MLSREEEKNESFVFLNFIIFNYCFCCLPLAHCLFGKAVCVWFGFKMKNKRIGRDERGEVETKDITKSVLVLGEQRSWLERIN